MDIDEAHRTANRLINLAAANPDSEEGRSAAAKAAKIMRAYGLLIVRPSDLAPTVQAPTLVSLPPVPPPAPKPKRRRPSKQEINEAAETTVTVINSAGQIVSALNGFRSVLRGGR